MCVYDDNELREMILSDTVFLDKETLVPGYIPSKLSEVLHRKDIIKEYAMLMKSAVTNVTPSNILLYGKSGTGKTMLTKLVTSEVAKLAYERGIKLNVVTISCESTKTDMGIMRTIVEHFEPVLINKSKKSISHTAYSHSAYFQHMIQELKKHETNEITVIFFDEVDKINNPNILNQFARLKENGLTEHNVCIICATNDLNFKDKLNYQTTAAFRYNELTFTPYDTDQLRDIMTIRSKVAFKPGAITDGAILYGAAIAGKFVGNARVAIELLRTAGEIADGQLSKTVEETHIREADIKNENQRIRKVVSTLPYHSKRILLSQIQIESKCKVDKSTIDEIRQGYIKLCDDDDNTPLSDRRIYELIDELTTLGIMSCEKRSYGKRGGLNKTIRLAYDATTLESMMGIGQNEGGV